MNIKNWFWDPITLALIETIVWDSGKRDVNWESKDRLLVITNGFWHIKVGYEWDGTSGVPDGPFITDHLPPVYTIDNKVPITWKASLIHDIGYEYMDEEDFPYTRKEIDNYFRILLEECGFKYSKLYWWGVRTLGAIYHWLMKLI